MESHYPCSTYRHEEKDGSIITEFFDSRNGCHQWLKDDLFHRDDDLPAVIEGDGTMKWYQNGNLHREGDKPAVIFGDGSMTWYWKDKVHRIGGPAAICLGSRWWFRDGVLHRDDDLPAMLDPDGTKYWYEDGNYIGKFVGEWVIVELPRLRVLVQKEGVDRDIFGELLKRIFPDLRFTYNMIRFLYAYLLGPPAKSKEEFQKLLTEIDA